MISNMTATILFLITSSIKIVASSSSSGTQEPSSSGKSVPPVRKRGRAPKSKKPTSVLRDTTNTVSPVEVQVRNTEEASTPQRQPTSQIKSRFGELMERGEYNKIIKLGKTTGFVEYLKQLFPVLKTLKQYKELKHYLKKRGMVASIYIHGDMGVVKEIIIDSGVRAYDENNRLGFALPLALEKNHYGRFIDLLTIRMDITAEEDEQRKQQGYGTSFETFVYWFLSNLAPWENDGAALKRLLTTHGGELRKKHPVILDTLCQELVNNLRQRLDAPNVEKLFADLIGQPSLLISVSFVERFLEYADGKCYSIFIKYAWQEAIVEGLRTEYGVKTGKLWQTMKRDRPGEFIGEDPLDPDVLPIVLAKFPTKQQAEERWRKESASRFQKELESLHLYPIPTVLWAIIAEYVISSWLDIE